MKSESEILLDAHIKTVNFVTDKLFPAIPLKTKPKEYPLVELDDCEISYFGERITSCTLRLYGSDIPRCGEDEPAHLDIRKVTIDVDGDEQSIDDDDVEEYLTAYYYENR